MGAELGKEVKGKKYYCWNCHEWRNNITEIKKCIKELHDIEEREIDGTPIRFLCKFEKKLTNDFD